MQVVPAAPGDVVISIDYAPDGIAWARLFDNSLLGWCVDETGAGEAVPSIVGQLPPVAAAAGDVISPQWAQLTGSIVFVPDLWRGNTGDFFTWLATNNGVVRPLAARFGVSHILVNDFATWASANPGLVYVEPEDAGTTYVVGKRGSGSARHAPSPGRTRD